jgi:alanine-glyoxylate transaminase/serine-glyoxylate transaminase/serine-pyruvate transaminase
MTRFTAPHRRLMGPGPSPVHQRVLDAMAQPTTGHMDPFFIGMMDSLKGMLQKVYRTENAMTFALSAPGSAGMEACLGNLIEAGDTVVVCVNGVFGGRMVDNVRRMGATPVVVEFPWGTPVDPERVEDALRTNPQARVLAFVHAETSTGVVSDAETLCALARRYDCLSVVDAVTSLGGMPVLVDAWGIDAVYSGSQKCLSCPPGLSPLSFSPRALAAIAARKTPVQSWFLDLRLIMDYWGKDASNTPRVYHHTAPVNALYGLHEAVAMVLEEGLEAVWARHQRVHQHLVRGLEAADMEMLVAVPHRLPMLNAVRVPQGVDEAAVRRRLLEQHDLEIGPGLGPLKGQIWRIGLMGNGCHEADADFCLGALAEELTTQAVA